MNPQRLPLNGNAHRQVAAKVLRWKASAHPSTTKKIVGKVKYIFVTGCKVHFCDQKFLCQHLHAAKGPLERRFFDQIGPVAAFMRIMGIKAPKAAR